ncbi:MAG: hypothetical protein CMB67_01925 [Euryarchaeota archaeon]|nr:hypothetical protein [Euryarchaeota archaeon]
MNSWVLFYTTISRVVEMRYEVTPEDAAWMLSLSSMPEAVSITPLQGGWDNTIVLLRLANGDEVVLKAWSSNSVEEVKRVISRHVHLHAYEIPTTVPISLDSGSLFAEKEEVAWTLLPYVSGGMLGKDCGSLRSLGEVMAKMHGIPCSEFFPEDYRMGFKLFEKVLEISKEKGIEDPFLDLLEKENSALLNAYPTRMPMGVLHGDLFPDNVLGKDGVVSAILDLEEAWIGPMIFDLMMAFVGFGWEEGKPQSNRWKSLVEGYQTVRVISEEELSELQLMHRYATLAIACWRFWKHNISVPDENLSLRHLEMVDRMGVDIDFKGYI